MHGHLQDPLKLLLLPPSYLIVDGRRSRLVWRLKLIIFWQNSAADRKGREEISLFAFKLL